MMGNCNGFSVGALTCSDSGRQVVGGHFEWAGGHGGDCTDIDPIVIKNTGSAEDRTDQAKKQCAMYWQRQLPLKGENQICDEEHYVF